MRIFIAVLLLFLVNISLATEDDTELYCEGTEKATLIGIGLLAEGNKTLNIKFNEQQQKLKLGFKPCLGELENEETKFTDRFISYECSSLETRSANEILMYSTSLNINRHTGELVFLHNNTSTKDKGKIFTYYSMKCNATSKKF